MLLIPTGEAPPAPERWAWADEPRRVALLQGGIAVYALPSSTEQGVLYTVTITPVDQGVFIHCTCPHGRFAHRSEKLCKHGRSAYRAFREELLEVRA